MTISTMMQIGCNKKAVLHCDLETFSSVDLPSAGLFKYTESPDFEILLLAYAWDDSLVSVLDLTSELSPEDEDEYRRVLRALIDPDVIKVAHNCAFERACLARHTGNYMPPEQWQDTMLLASMNGLPSSLDAAGEALNIGYKKIKEGVALIRYFCVPCKPTISNGGRTRNLPEHAPDKWERFKAYCKRDVEAEHEIYSLLHAFPIPEWERAVFALDARINERGVQIDRELVESAVAVDAESRQKNLEGLKNLTELDNPNSVSQLRGWLENRGLYLDKLDKGSVSEAISDIEDPTIRRVLELRQLLGKTSTKKYEAMLNAASEKDDRIRGMMQYYGAGRTGRWAGRIVQPQNLPQNHLENIGEVREVCRRRDLDTMEMCFSSVPDTLSQLIRTALVARHGSTFLVADYSAIEARVIAYLAGEKWRMEVFANGGDIYCSSASQMFKVPVEKHGINKHLRQKGKIAELACGYGGGVNALRAFGADKMGLSEEEMTEIVKQWRAASPSIPKFWKHTESAAVAALCQPGKEVRVCNPDGFGKLMRLIVTYWRDRDALRCRLPSGRILSYWGAHLDDDGAIRFMAQNQTTKKWELSQTWGGKLVENIVQAYARDCLAVAMLRLDAEGYKICFSVHDELIAEEPNGGRTWQEMAEIMGKPIPWAPGLILRADGYDTDFYKKD